jgi:alkyl hydroperoxide reductase subunit AhpC
MEERKCCKKDGGSCCDRLQVGKVAPKVELEGYYKGDKKQFSYDDYEGKWKILFFYPLDFTFVCPTELLELSKRHSEFEEVNTQVLGISVDSVFSHEAWSKELGDLNFPLLSDMAREVSKAYGVLLKDKGITLRGAFLVSPDGILKSMIVNDLEIGRNVDELLRLVKAFQTGELCPINWTPGGDTLGKA